MTSDLDIYCAAQALVKQHGPDAPIEAAMRVDELLKADGLDGYTVCRRNDQKGLQFNNRKASFLFP